MSNARRNGELRERRLVESAGRKAHSMGLNSGDLEVVFPLRSPELRTCLEKGWLEDTRGCHVKGQEEETSTTEKADIVAKAALNAGEYLGLSNADLVRILWLKKNASTVARGNLQLEQEPKSFRRAVLLVRLLYSLDSITDGASEVSSVWLHNVNSAFGNVTPLQYIQNNKDGLVNVIDYLDSVRASL